MMIVRGNRRGEEGRGVVYYMRWITDRQRGERWIEMEGREGGGFRG